MPRGNTAIAELTTRPPEIAINRLLGAVAAGIVPVWKNIAIVRNAPKGRKYLRRKPVLPAADIQTRRTESRGAQTEHTLDGQAAVERNEKNKPVFRPQFPNQSCYFIRAQFFTCQENHLYTKYTAYIRGFVRHFTTFFFVWDFVGLFY